MKKKIKTHAAELGALLLLTLLLTTPTSPVVIPPTSPTITDGIITENPNDAVQTNSDKPDPPYEGPSFGQA